ncbi:PepSY domain-containing protein [Chitinimonas lacunae]|uniref:PepSY domain-containing protein n=1 Tax=Chitinimonas lacunae TaxID=1963018 RepID=A0ABV8MQE9_9NEIS
MKRLFACLMTLSLLAAAPAVWAKASRDDAAATAQRITGGRVLSVEQARQQNREVWRVKVVTPAGEVRVVLIDIETGNPV